MMKQRVAGFDTARALAVFGMVIVNFKIAMSANTGHSALIFFAKLFEGRSSALFVVLAGIGITLLTSKARATADAALALKTRLLLIKRGILLIVIGLLYTPIWEADILHFYGFYFLMSAIIFSYNDKTLLRLALGITFAFPILMLLFDYEKHWDWATLAYENFWSLDGMVRHILFNGFHPVIPWLAFLIFGMWLGRLDLSNKATRKQLLIKSLIVLIVVETTFYLLRFIIGDGTSLGMTAGEVTFLFSISIIPPLPQYIISASCSSVIVLIACLYFSENFENSVINKVLNRTGKMSLTLYVAHIILGMGFLESLGLLENQTIGTSLVSAMAFCTFAMAFSTLWLSRFKTGPLEWVFRKIAS